MIVGVVNTGIDLSIFTILVNAGINGILGNYVSTSVAMLFGFFATRYFTFGSTDSHIKTQFINFIAATIIGLWVIQPIVLFASQRLLGDSVLAAVAGKCLATGASLLWNYIMYSKVVFKG